MKANKIFKFRPSVAILFVTIAATFFLIRCDDGRSGGDDSGENQQSSGVTDENQQSSGDTDENQQPDISTLDTIIPIDIFPTFSLTAGVPETYSYHIDLPEDFDLGELAEAYISPDGTLPYLSIIRTDGQATQDPTVDFTIKVSAGNDPSACADGTQALRMEFTGDEQFTSIDVSVDEGTMPQTAMDIINSGDFTLCGSVTSSVGAEVTLTGLDTSFAFTGDCEDDPQDLSGVWTGEYYCDDVCDGISNTTPKSPVEITIIQSGETAIYWDESGAIYIGSVCDTSFRHFGFGSGYFEYGTFTRSGTTTATKTSYWESFSDADCGGTCHDELTLSP